MRSTPSTRASVTSQLNDVSAANFLKSIISNATNITQGIRDSKEKIMPNTPVDEGMIIKNPEANPHKPTDFLNLWLFINA